MRSRAAVGLLAAGLLVGGPARGQTEGAAPAGVAPAAARVANAADLRRRLGLDPEYAAGRGIGSVKVAVLDSGFDGIGTGRPYLPAGTTVVEHYDPEFVRKLGLGDPDFRKEFEPLERHGRVMAQTVWAATGSRPEGPRFYLLNANGPTMLRRAVRYAIEQGVDLILFSGSFEGGGDGDGRGPINRAVSEALAAGIPWINAAGNRGGRVYGGPIRVLPDGYLRLRDRGDIAALRFRNRLDENTVTVTVTWNDYREEEDAGTDKDLDVTVEDWAGRVVGVGDKVQVSGAAPAGPGESRNPRERVVLPALAATPEIRSDPDYTYRIRVKARRGRFTAADRLRVLVTASREMYLPPGASAPREAIEFLDASGREELYPPADHPLVLTVGDDDPSSSLGPTADRRVKPDAIVPDARVYLTDGEVSAGSSSAAACVAGVVAVLKAAEPSLGPADLLRIARRGPTMRPGASRGAGRGTNADGLILHLWRTPGRGQLADLLRTGPARADRTRPGLGAR